MSFFVLAVKQLGTWAPEITEPSYESISKVAEKVHCDGIKVTDKKILIVSETGQDLTKQISNLNNG